MSRMASPRTSSASSRRGPGNMSGSNAWAEFANLYRLTRPAALDHDRAKTELKALVPEDAREAAGHGVRAKRSKSGAISFEVLELEASHAALQR